MKKEKFVVLDVEGMSAVRPYNIGYVIADRDGKIYKHHSFAVPECLYENLQNALITGQAIDMTKHNIQEILTDTGNPKRKRKYKLISANEFYHFFSKELKKHKVKRLFAYNVSFDKSALKRLFGEKRFNSLNLEYCDIISGILTTKLLTKKYINFCLENGFITEKGNIMTKAEIVYKYLTNCLDFIEEHTGLSDVLIEYDILLTVFKAHKKVDFAPCQAWRILKKFCKENELI